MKSKPARHCSVAALLGLVLSGLTAATALAQVEVQRGRPSVTIEPGTATLIDRRADQDALERPVAPDPSKSTETQVDVRGVWFHLNRQDPQAARQELERLQSLNPGWQASKELTTLLRDALVREAATSDSTPVADRPRLDSAQACADPQLAWTQVDRGIESPELLQRMAASCWDGNVASASMTRHLARFKPNTRAAEVRRLQAQRQWPPSVRSMLDAMSFDAEMAALGGLQPEQVRSLPEERLTRFGNMATAQRNAGAAIMLGWHHLSRDKNDSAVEWFERASQWGKPDEAREGLAQAQLARATAAAQAGDLERARDALRARRELGRSDGGESIGWMLLEAQRPADAARFFAEAPQTEDVIFGHVLALRRQGEAEQALSLACNRIHVSARLDQNCAELLVEAMVLASEAGDHREVLTIGEQLATYGLMRDDASAMLAWSNLQLGNDAAAAGLFEPLLQTHDRDDYAIGLVESLRGPMLRDRLADAANRHPRVAAIIAIETRDRAIARKQFDLAERLDPAGALSTGRLGWEAKFGFDGEYTRGTKGRDKSNLLAPQLGVEGMLGDLRVGLTISAPEVRTGHPSSSADIGLRPTGPDQFAPTDSSSLADIRLRLRRESPDHTLFAALGSTPAGGEVSARPTGEIGMTKFADPFSITTRLFSQAQTGSLLSLSGLRDPVSGQRWGRVTDSGVSVLGVWAPEPGYSVAIGAEAAAQHGRDVADNHRYRLRGDLNFNLDLDEFDYFRVGPYLSWSSHDRNLSHYTLGHGGYFSPQLDVRSGIALDALSPEGQRRQFRVSASMGYSRVVEDAAPRFPGSPQPGEPYARSSTRGLAGDVSLQWMVLINPQLMVGGFAGFASAPDYDHGFGGVMLRIPFEPRRGLVSPDLPFSALRPPR